MKRKIIVTVVILLLLGVGWWYYDVGSWKEVPSMELLYQYSSGSPFRTESNKKFDPDFYTWYSYFGPEDFRTPDHKAIYDACQKLYGFDFDQYTYILSYGFTIEKLSYQGDYAEPKARLGRVVHGTGCSPDAILLYRIPKAYLMPCEDRRDSYAYKFIQN